MSRNQIVREHDAARTSKRGKRTGLNKDESERANPLVLEVLDREIGNDSSTCDGFPFLHKAGSIPHKRVYRARVSALFNEQKLVLGSVRRVCNHELARIENAPAASTQRPQCAAVQAVNTVRNLVKEAIVPVEHHEPLVLIQDDSEKFLVWAQLTSHIAQQECTLRQLQGPVRVLIDRLESQNVPFLR